MNTRKKSSALRSKPSLSRGPESYAFIVGLLAGLVPALLFILVFIFARIGPRGFLWWEGKGGETVPTPSAGLSVQGQEVIRLEDEPKDVLVYDLAFSPRPQPLVCAFALKRAVQISVVPN
jgi:hypothetical protein